MLNQMAQWARRIYKWASGSWARWIVAALPYGVLAIALVALYALFSRPRPLDNPDLDEAREAGRAEERAESATDAINEAAAKDLARSKGMTDDELKKSLMEEVNKS